MCGVFFASRPLEVAEGLPILAVEMETRGSQSWGCGQQGGITKGVGAISYHWQDAKPEDLTVPTVWHTRAATSGAVTAQNAHPFKFNKPDGGFVVGVHNGIIANHQELNKKYGREFEVDSMHVFAHIAEGRETKEICGYGTIAWLEVDGLHFAKFNGGALFVGRLPSGEIVGASTRLAVEAAVRICGHKVEEVDVKTEREYKYENGAVVEVRALPFGFRYQGSISTTRESTGYCGGTNSTIPSYSERKKRGVCAICTVNIDRKKELVCGWCLRQFAWENGGKMHNLLPGGIT